MERVKGEEVRLLGEGFLLYIYMPALGLRDSLFCFKKKGFVAERVELYRSCGDSEMSGAVGRGTGEVPQEMRRYS